MCTGPMANVTMPCTVFNIVRKYEASGDDDESDMCMCVCVCVCVCVCMCVCVCVCVCMHAGHLMDMLTGEAYYDGTHANCQKP